MTTLTSSDTALDEAFERMAQNTGVWAPNGFLSHGPMACEALFAMTKFTNISDWGHMFAQGFGPAIRGEHRKDFEEKSALGSSNEFPAWIGFFEDQINACGWEQVLRDWVPRLVDGIPNVLFHAAIHVAHAARALTSLTTEPRRRELARALGFWAAYFEPAATAHLLARNEGDPDHVLFETVELAGHAAACYVTAPTIVHLHLVTGTMAVALLVGHVGDEEKLALYARIRGIGATMLQDIAPRHIAHVNDPEAERALSKAGSIAAPSFDAHKVKLVEACIRGYASSGNPAFIEAAKVVTS